MRYLDNEPEPACLSTNEALPIRHRPDNIDALINHLPSRVVWTMCQELYEPQHSIPHLSRMVLSHASRSCGIFQVVPGIQDNLIAH
jgi:hypothetical protein